MFSHCFNNSFLNIVVSTFLILFLIIINFHDVGVSIEILSFTVGYISFKDLDFCLYFSEIITFLMKMNVILFLIGLLNLLTLFSIFSLHYTLFLGNLILHFHNIALCLLDKPISFVRLTFYYEKRVIDHLHQFFSLGLL